MSSSSDVGWGSRWLDLVIPLGLVAAFVLWVLPWSDFLLDDAYITFRYAEHLAEGHGIVWNVGADPVEGTSSMLWVLVTALGVPLGIGPPSLAQAVGIAAGAISIVLVYGAARRAGVTRPIAGAAGAVMALSPAFAFIALQGMETTLAGLIALAATLAALRFADQPRPGSAAVTSVAILLGGTARPELVPFGAGLLAGTAWRVSNEHGRSAVRRLAGWAGALLVLPGAIYMAWRWSTFGYPLPNSFYAKEANSLRSLTHAGDYVFTFVLLILGPLLFLAAWRLLRDDDPAGRLRRLAGPLAAGAAFLVPLLGVSPIQAFLWRYQMPALPALALTVALLVRSIPLDDWGPRWSSTDWDAARPWIALLLVLGLVAFPMHPFREVGDEYLSRHQGDRVAAGQALAPLSDEDLRMFVTESGAVPYYSGWTAVDALGLNNETIAHEGLSVDLLERYEPDLVMMLAGFGPDAWERRHAVTTAYLEEGDYELAAAINKTHASGAVHVYLVDPDGSHASAITCALLTIEDVDHVPRDRVLAGQAVDVEPRPEQPADCA